MITLLEFFFQSFFHWLGGLIYLIFTVGALGMAFGLIAELFRRK